MEVETKELLSKLNLNCSNIKCNTCSCHHLTRTAKENWKKFELREVRVKRFWDLKWKIVEERIM